MRHRSLPRLMIAIPCSADWRAMEPIAGDSRARLCRSCDKPVYDSKSMTRDELHALIVKTEGALPCLQLHLRSDGTVVTKGCFAALYRTGRDLWLKTAAIAVAFWASVTGLRRVCDTATAPQAVSVELAGPTRIMRGMGSLLIVPPEPPWLHPPAHAQKLDIDHGEPLRHLQIEDELLPTGLRR